ncbi:MAG: type II toxin-antitoxin system VapB family antitoxin [Sphingomonas bacterium]|nr:type II toxin-antitoxin system VapB family antitoxin [Sphingomonas bacterium]
MALSIKDPETDALVRKLARRRRTSFTGAIRLAVRNELAKDEKPKKDIVKLRASVAEIQARWAAAPDLMSDKEVDAFMYDENGLPH